MGTTRKFQDSPAYQGADEEIIYWFDTTPWGGSVSTPPSSPTAVIKDGGNDVSTTHLTGSASVYDTTKIKTPKVIGLVPERKYRLEVKFTIDGNVLEAYTEIIGET